MRGALALLVLSSTVFTVQDPRIDENSGMVDLGSLTVITNDSGDTGRLFVLDGRGRTVGVTTYADGPDQPVDVEALAPAGDDAVWVGDIGDNDRERDDVVVRRVPVARGDRQVSVPAYRLVYPDGPHDAETLLRDPSSGRLYVVTKALSGGVVYAVPRRLDADATNRMTKVAALAIYATDGAFLAGGRRVLVRGYGAANLYAFPSWRLLRTFALPAQPQGESLSVGPGDRVRIGSEGERQPVLSVTLPGSASPSAAPEDRVVGAAEARRHTTAATRRTTLLVVGAPAAAALVLGAVALTRRKRWARRGFTRQGE